MSTLLITRRARLALVAAAALLGGLVVTVATPSRALAAATLPPGFAQSQVAHGMTRPTSMAFTPDGRILVSQQDGHLRVIKSGALLATPALTLTVDSTGERGLIGVAVDPNFAADGWVYVQYTTTTPTTHNRVSRFTMSGDIADPSSELVLLDIDDLSTLNQHNSGALHFGPDGKLYIAVGDNQDGNNSQSMATLKGKILRINPDGSIPADNPYVSQVSGRLQAIWAIGFRNPFTFGIQPTTGLTYVNDVGQDSWEEIDQLQAGHNYGWPLTEGYTSDPRYTTPLYAYPHGAGTSAGCAITGGDFYNPPAAAFPSQYVGLYFFNDFCNGWISTYNSADHTINVFATGINQDPVSLTVGPDGAIYLLSVSDQPDGVGSLYEYAYTGSLAPSIGTQPLSQVVSTGHSATFTVSASGNAPLSYQWSLNGTAISGATGPSYTTANLDMTNNGDQYTVTVTNGYGSATSQAAVVTMTTAQPPTPTITSPDPSVLYVAGQTITYSGTATDPQDGTLPASAYSWRIDFGHHLPGTPNAHFHPFIPDTPGVTGGTFVIPSGGETDPDVYYRIILTVTDSAGLVTKTYEDIHPQTANVTVASNPSGMLLSLDGQPRTAPYTFTGVVGLNRTLDVFTPQTVGGVVWAFGSWSDSQPQHHAIATPTSDTTYTANFYNAHAGTISLSPNPQTVCDASGAWTDTVNFNTTGVTSVEVHLNSPGGPTFAVSQPGAQVRTTGNWVHEATTFYLQDTSGGAPLTAANTLATAVAHASCLTAAPNPIQVCDASNAGSTTLSWNTTNTTAVELHVGSPTGALVASTGAGPQQVTTASWVTNGTVFYLQNTSSGPASASNTMGTTVVNTTTTGCTATGSISLNPNPIQVCDGSGVGTGSITWSAGGTPAVEVHVNSPTGSVFAAAGSGTQTRSTGNWVRDGMIFYLQDVSQGPASAANTLASVVAHLTQSGCAVSGTIGASPNAIQVCDGTTQGTTTISFNSVGTASVEVHLNSPAGSTFAVAGPGQQVRTTGKWVTDGMTFYLQNTSGGLALTAANTLATVTVHVTQTGCPPAGSISASPNPIQVCDRSGQGMTTLSWTSSWVTAVEVHLNSPTGPLFASRAAGSYTKQTGKWVSDGMVIYLQNTSGGLPLTSANTLATVTVHLTTAGC